MKNALILGYNKFPQGDAGAVRLESFAKILISLGYNVTIVGLGACTDFKYQKKDGLNYISLRHKSNSFFAQFLFMPICFLLLDKKTVVGSFYRANSRLVFDWSFFACWRWGVLHLYRVFGIGNLFNSYLC